MKYFYLALILLITFSLLPGQPGRSQAAPPETPAPTVIQRTPERGEELPLDRAIELVFDREMDRPSVESAFSINMEGFGLESNLEGSFEWPDSRTFRFHPASPLVRGETYYVRLGPEARAADGTPLAEAYRFRFSTVGFLEATQVIPAPDALDVGTESTIMVMFNRPVVPLTAIEEQAALPQPLTFEPEISGKGEWLNTSIYLFTPDKPLAGGTKYTARILAGLTDTTGGLLEKDYVWSFTTLPPTVAWTGPGDGETLVAPTAPIKITFTQPVDPASAKAAFHLRTLEGEEIGGEFEIKDVMLTFRPAKMLDFNRTYEALLEPGAKSISGGEGMRAEYRWRFTTVPLPRILETWPHDGERKADPYTPFQIVFNAPIDPATVMPNISMTPPLSPTQVYTYFESWDNTFVLHFGAQPSAEYEVRIGPNIADPYGNTTGQEMTIRFRTAPLEPSVALRVPGPVGTYNAADPARLFVAYRNTDWLDFRLYQLTPEDFFRAQQDWYDFAPPWDGLLREWSLYPEAPLNEMKYIPVDLAGGGRMPPGLYLLEVDSPHIEFHHWAHRHLLVVSEINLTLKEEDDGVLVWATDLPSGKPVEGLNLEARDYDGNPLGTATTDADGLAYLPSTLYVLSKEPFTLASTEWSSGISPWDFGFTHEHPTDWRVHIYTDRPIYRAGQNVYFRGIVRAEDDARYRLSELEKVQVRVYDAAGEEVYNQELALDEFGAFNGELALADGAALGEYRIEAEFAWQTFSASFQVAAYRPPEFEVKVQPAVPEIAAGERIEAAIEVSYFFGGPVADAPVDWRVLAEPYRFRPPQYGRYTFTDTDDPWYCFDCWWLPSRERGQVILSGSGRTDSHGLLKVELPADLLQEKKLIGSQKLTIEASVSGPDGSVIAGRKEVIVHRGEFYIGLSPQQYVGRAGKEMAVDIITLDWNAARWPNQKLKAIVYRREWINTFVEDEFGGGQWKWETKDTPVFTTTLTTDENGQAKISFTPPEGGSYRILVNGYDSAERTVQSSLFLWVSGPGYVSWRMENNDRIALITDKSTYKVGETAQVLIPSPFSGPHWALITVERGGILYHEVILLESNSQVYELPIIADYIPNIYVSAVIVKGQDEENPVANYKVGYAALSVEPEPKKLHITLRPGVERAGPGDRVAWEVKVTDESGEPVQAALSLDLVDKAVLSLSPRPQEAIVKAFYGKRGLGVSTSSGLSISINRLVLQQMEELGLEYGRGGGPPPAPGAKGIVAAMPAPTAVPIEAQKEAAPAPPLGVTLREKFADTAYWNANVVTDRTGRAEIEIALPDNLTTWVMRGVGITSATDVGEGTAELLVTKPLLIRPVAPRFFVVDDEVELAAIVNNNTREELEVEVALSQAGLKLETVEKQLVTIPPGGEAKVMWEAKVLDVENAELIFSAVAGKYSDAARPRITTGPEGTLIVHRYSAPEVVGTGGQLLGEEMRREVVALPPKYDERHGELSIRLDPSLAAGMREGLTYLRHFPYECTEQVVSRFLPNVLTYRALKELGIEDPELEEKLPGLVKTGLEKLYLQQHDDGGWGWWAGGDSNPHLTAYVLFGLVKARQAGFEVDANAIARSLNYLSSHLITARHFEDYRQANRQAFILYVLAEAGETAWASEYTGDLFNNREKLSHYGRAFLALSMSLIDPEDGRIQTLLSDLASSAILSATGAHWEEENYDWWAMNTDTRSTAVILDALARLDLENALIPNVVRWLMVARKEGIWETTQETAWALVALTDWMVVTGELKGEYDYLVELNEKELASGAVSQAKIGESVKLRVDVTELLRDQGNIVDIWRGAGPGRLYYTAHLRVYLPVEEIEPLNRGIAVFRQYSRADCSAGEKCPEVDEAQVGDVIKVKLTIVAPHDLYYVVLEDPLPAGAEAIDPKLATTGLLEQEPALYRQAEDERWGKFYRWWWSWYSRSEIRDDKVVLFADYLPAGTYEYVYTFRATLPGQYHVIPTFANEMYFPEVFGRSEGRLLTISAAEK